MQTKPVVEQIFGDNKAPIRTVLEADFAGLTRDVDAFLAEAGKLPGKLKDDADLGVFGQHVTDLRSLAARVEGIRKQEGQPLLEATRDINAFFNSLKAKVDDARAGLEDRATDYTREKERRRRAEAAALADENRRREEAERAKAAATETPVTAARADARAEQFGEAAARYDVKANARPAELVRTHTATGVTASAKTTYDFAIEDYEAIDLNKLRPYLARADVEKAIRSLVRIQKGATALPGVRVFEDTKATFRK